MLKRDFLRAPLITEAGAAPDPATWSSYLFQAVYRPPSPSQQAGYVRVLLRDPAVHPFRGYVYGFALGPGVRPEFSGFTVDRDGNIRTQPQ